MLPNTAIIIIIIIIIISIIIIILLFWNMSATSFHELFYVRFIAMECPGTFFSCREKSLALRASSISKGIFPN